MERIAGIYEFINTITGDIYVGQSVDIHQRYKTHLVGDSLIDKAIKEYGIENFEFIIYKVIDTTNLTRKELKQILDAEEIKRISELECCINVHGKGYNKSMGGGGSSFCPAWNKGISCIGHPLSDEAKEKISKANKGKVRTEEQRKNISKAIRKRFSDASEREKISKATKGRPAWNKGRNDYITEEAYNKMIIGAKKGSIIAAEKTRGIPRSDEFKSKVSEKTKEAMNKPEIRQKFLEVVQSDEFRQKQSDKMKKYWSDSKREELSKKQTGYVWFNDGTKNYRVYPDKYEYYESNGYTRGFLK